MEEKNIVRELFKLINSITSAAKRFQTMYYNKNGKSKKDELTVPQFHMIRYISLYEKDGCTLKNISEKIDISKGALSILVSKLEMLGYVKRNYNATAEDKRKVYLSLTEKGFEKLKKKQEELAVHLNAMIDNISEDDRKYLEEHLPKMVQIVEKYSK